jgi:hypothetical protein
MSYFLYHPCSSFPSTTRTRAIARIPHHDPKNIFEIFKVTIAFVQQKLKYSPKYFIYIIFDKYSISIGEEYP